MDCIKPVQIHPRSPYRKPDARHLLWATGPQKHGRITSETNLENDLGFAEKAAGPCVFVLFGAAGDLTKRKLVPALFNLGKAKLLPENFAVIGVSVDDLSLEDFRSQVTSFLPAGS